MNLLHVSKTYGDRTVLEDVSLTLEEGKITAVLGESGAGKTTLLNILAGLTPYQGEVEKRPAVSYLFQDATLLPHLTVEGNLKFVLPKEKWGGIADMVCRVGLKGREKSLPKELSGGERQRVAIARAFLYPHELLLLDEPFASLDLALKSKLIELIAGLHAERKETVVFVTHDVHEAAMLSHRAVVLKGGKIVCDLASEGSLPRDFLSHPPLEDALVRVLMGSGDRS